MEMNKYQELAERTISDTSTEKEQILEAALGLAGECGEVVDHIKKVRFQGHQMDTEYLSKELGDILWYIAEMSTALNISLESVALGNIEKLRNRYPITFSSERSVNRID